MSLLRKQHVDYMIIQNWCSLLLAVFRKLIYKSNCQIIDSILLISIGTSDDPLDFREHLNALIVCYRVVGGLFLRISQRFVRRKIVKRLELKFCDLFLL